MTALMRAAPNWEAFKRSLVRAFPKPKEQIPFGVDENCKSARLAKKEAHL